MEWRQSVGLGARGTPRTVYSRSTILKHEIMEEAQLS